MKNETEVKSEVTKGSSSDKNSAQAGGECRSKC
jgi:hypothetical protein